MIDIVPYIDFSVSDTPVIDYPPAHNQQLLQKLFDIRIRFQTALPHRTLQKTAQTVGQTACIGRKKGISIVDLRLVHIFDTVNPHRFRIAALLTQILQNRFQRRQLPADRQNIVHEDIIHIAVQLHNDVGFRFKMMIEGTHGYWSASAMPVPSAFVFFPSN